MPALLATMLPAGCVTVPFNPPAAPASVITDKGVKFPCPHVKTYSKAQMSTAADELTALPPNSVVAQIVIDDAQLRKQAAACR